MFHSLKVALVSLFFLFSQGVPTYAADCNALVSDRLSEFSSVNNDDIDFFKEQSEKVLSLTKTLPLKEALSVVLAEKNFNAAEIKQRINEYQAQAPGALERVLGDRTLDEVRKMYIGESIENISSNSLLGQYLAETGAQTKIIRFPIAPGSRKLGPPKLLVAFSAQSWDALQAVWNTDNYMTTMGHANIIHRNKFFRFGGGQYAKFGIPSEFTPLPFLIVKTTEAERLNRYMIGTVNHAGWYDELKQPWKLPHYCAKGGYTCCTHWIGNIPIGDKLVSEYKFPLYDKSAKHAVSKTLSPYEGGQDDIRKIWRVPGHEQLASVIGLEQNNLNGEFASPGWVIQTLMGSGSTERVPLIFISTKDHRAPLPKTSEFHFEEPW